MQRIAKGSGFAAIANHEQMGDISQLQPSMGTRFDIPNPILPFPYLHKMVAIGQTCSFLIQLSLTGMTACVPLVRYLLHKFLYKVSIPQQTIISRQS